MNFPLIFKLSLFGLFMAVGTVFFIPPNIEPAFWLVIFLVCAFLIAKRAPGKFFLHGFCLSLMNCVWVTGAHVAFFQAYVNGHPHEAQLMTQMPMPDRPQAMMLLMGPVVGIVTGLVQGLFAWIASKFIKP